MTNIRQDDGMDLANTRQESNNPTSSSSHMVDNRSNMTNTRQDDGLDMANTRQESNPTSSSGNIDDDGLDMTNTRQGSNLASSSSNIVDDRLDIVDACQQSDQVVEETVRVLEMPLPIQPIDGSIGEQRSTAASDPRLRTQRRGSASQGSSRVPPGTSSTSREKGADRTSRNNRSTAELVIID